MTTGDWPALPYDEWRETCATLHMYTQVVGKFRLVLSPFEPEWANVALYLSARGLITGPMPVGSGTVDAELDLLDHALVLRASDGAVERVPLGGSVAAFHGATVEAMGRLGVDATINEMPSEVADPIPFTHDTRDTYDRDQVRRFFAALSAVDVVLKEHRARFRGRCSPVHFFWGSFDLAMTRYSGRAAPPPPGADVITRFSADVEEICAGWWPGSATFPEAALYAYASPKPEGLERAPIRPGGAGWDERLGEFILRHADVAAAADPRRAVLDFLESTYEQAARAMEWDPGLTEVAVPR